jgi:DNA topoisomerase-1
MFPGPRGNPPPAAGHDGQLFPELSAAQLNEHVGRLGGGKFTTKDFRTVVGTQMAQGMIVEMRKPKDQRAYGAAVKDVVGRVSKQLGNTPNMAYNSYINPVVWEHWNKGQFKEPWKRKFAAED